MILRTITCDAPECKHLEQEQAPGAGWPGWGAIQGIAIDGKENPSLCPRHLKAIADFICPPEKNDGSVD